jgi:hypothetical protein
MAAYVLRRLLTGSRLRKIGIERLTEPLHLNIASLFVGMFGSYRTKVALDLIIRPQYAYSILRAAEQAIEYDIYKLTIIEFGVASGAGLFNMCRIAERTSKATGVQFRVVGFDTGVGMPAPIDYRDHPEQWQQGDFPMVEIERLRRALPCNAELIIGDLANTLPPFLDTVSAEQPIGFIAVDVDYYSSTKSALKVFNSSFDKYLPATLIYLDDIDHICSNEWAGELLAVSEFNSENELRKIAPFALLRSHRIFKNPQWIDHIYIAHVHDHAFRSSKSSRARSSFIIPNEYIS